jgi:hypothetical protein
MRVFEGEILLQWPLDQEYRDDSQKAGLNPQSPGSALLTLEFASGSSDCLRLHKNDCFPKSTFSRLHIGRTGQ